MAEKEGEHAMQIVGTPVDIKTVSKDKNANPGRRKRNENKNKTTQPDISTTTEAGTDKTKEGENAGATGNSNKIDDIEMEFDKSAQDIEEHPKQTHGVKDQKKLKQELDDKTKEIEMMHKEGQKELEKLGSQLRLKYEELTVEKEREEKHHADEILRLKKENEEQIERLNSDWRLECQQINDDKSCEEKKDTVETFTQTDIAYSGIQHLETECQRLNGIQEELSIQRKENEDQKTTCQNLEKVLGEAEQNLKQALESNAPLQTMKAELEKKKELENELRTRKLEYEQLQIQTKEIENVHMEKVQQFAKTENIARERLAQIQQLESEKAEYTTRVVAYSREKEEEIKKLNHAIQQKDQEYQQVNNYYQNEASKQLIAHERATANAKARYDSLSRDYEKLEEDRSSLVLRLSKVAGAKLTAGNSNIADLSDENRPTKLAEKFSELYDNEWTDAFEQVCVTMEESEGIQYMLSVLKTAFNLCNEITTGHFENMKKSATTIEFAVKKKIIEVQTNETQNVELEKHDTQTQNKPSGVIVPPTEKVIDRGEAESLSQGENTSAQTPDDITNTDNAAKADVDNMNRNNTPAIKNEEEPMDTYEKDGFLVYDNMSPGQTRGPTTSHSLSETTKDTSVVEALSQGQQHNVETNVDTGVQEPSEQRSDDNLLSNDATEQPPNEEEVETQSVSFTLSESLTSELYKQLLDLKKLIALQMQGNVLQEITKAVAMQFNDPEDKKSLMYKYIAKCVELCWYMGLQDPPLQIVFEIPDGETKFDANMYKAYTRTGKHLAYIVWPPLFLKEGGPMLMKGVAQGTG